MIKAIIFDCFGVVFSDNFEDNYRKFGGDLIKDKSFLEKVIFDSSSGKIGSSSRLIAHRLGISSEQWEFANASNRNFNTELLEFIKNIRLNYKVGMLSNVGNKGLGYYMDYAVLEDHFDDIVESAKIGFAKPEARAYEVAADRLRVRLDECIFIDDREKYVEGAQHVGMQAILYKDVAQLKRDIEKITTKYVDDKLYPKER